MIDIKFEDPKVRLNNLEEYLAQNKIKIVLIGDTHIPRFDEEVQRAIIEVVKPEYFLHEFLEDKEYVNKTSILKGLQTIRPNRLQDEHIFRLGLNFNLKLIGCDLKENGFYLLEDGSIPQEIQDAYCDLYPDDPAANAKLTDEPREIQMGKTIKKYSELSKRPVVAAVGFCHLKPNSFIYRELKGEPIYLLTHGSEIESVLALDEEKNLEFTGRKLQSNPKLIIT